MFLSKRFPEEDDDFDFPFDSSRKQPSFLESVLKGFENQIGTIKKTKRPGR